MKILCAIVSIGNHGRRRMCIKRWSKDGYMHKTDSLELADDALIDKALEVLVSEIDYAKSYVELEVINGSVRQISVLPLPEVFRKHYEQKINEQKVINAYSITKNIITTLIANSQDKTAGLTDILAASEKELDRREVDRAITELKCKGVIFELRHERFQFTEDA
jgi:hypothetical protein